MTIEIQEQIERMAETAVQKELSKLSQVVVKPSLTEIVSVGYEKWVQLIEAYSSTGKRDRYKYLAGVLAENFDIKVKPETLRTPAQAPQQTQQSAQQQIQRATAPTRMKK